MQDPHFLMGKILNFETNDKKKEIYYKLKPDFDVVLVNVEILEEFF